MKQVASPGKKPTASSSVEDRIVEVSKTVNGIRLSLYGRPKTGKTRLACLFPKPVLIIGTEDGTASVAGTPGLHYVRLKTCEELRDLTDGSVGAGKWPTVVLDNGTGFRDMRISEILGLSTLPVQKGFGFAGRDHWTECANSMKELFLPLFDLSLARGFNFIMIAQEQNFTSDESVAASDLITPTIGASLGKSVCDWVNARCDYIGNTFIREQILTKTLNVNNKPKQVTVKTGKKEYCLRVGPHEVYQTGFRLPEGRIDLPDVIVNPTYQKIVDLIEGRKPPVVTKPPVKPVGKPVSSQS